MFENKISLVTGGTSSFGNAVLDRFLSSGLKEIRSFSRNDKKQDDMHYKYRSDKVKFYIRDVRDYTSESAVLGVDYVQDELGKVL